MIAAVVLQRARKVVLSDWTSDEFLEDIDDVFRNMALKGIVNVVSAGDVGLSLDTNAWSPMITSNPDDGTNALACLCGTSCGAAVA